MKAIQLTEPKRFEQVDIAEPGKPGPGQVLVRTHRMGICGTDYSGYLGKMPFFSYPRIPGHELGVEVLEVGEGVANVKAGDRCSVEPYMNCGECYACRKGSGNCCENLKVIGVMTDGGLCEQFLIRAEKLHPSKSLNYEQLALVETLAIGCHACDRGDSQEGDHVLIIGAGPIGLATLEFVRLTGATITVMDMVESRLQFCRDTYGVSHTIQFKGDGSENDQIQQITNGDKYAVVIDATGHNGSMSNALNYVAHTGSLVYVGITTAEISFKHPVLHRPEITLKASRNAMPGDFTRIIGLIEDGTVNTDPWITHRTTFDTVIDEFETFTKPESGVIKAVISVT
ncbi:zinc-binding alcohol dehydrogenase family protein [Rubinisphaera brasiliensis]|uniref:L-iditol 2-dehydrogenase n=1 Tax=Rubinisphaera brasiliensis (strain ATCC 49424 / DSM 5305 / JCM 21570 / IAM 15109 / NBRC 103401 / IFAM 1448) TaxID=756272 RepID=F0STN0_RUBBR|nr:zinc-binding alcohol dehydrogenase family protein [Rubinisphaera brasiliensis]ADY61499.1 L-iditol 2-dehydrogenase [Rubinisphaera brasiliensis DSM 5305]